MTLKTKIGIIGAGPAGLTLALLLQRAGIECVILEARTRQYAESRVRAGLLEQNTVDLLNELGAADRMNREGLRHHGVYLSFDGDRIRVPFNELTGGRGITIYGQQEIVKDLIALNLERGVPIYFEAVAEKLEDIDTHLPVIHYSQQGELCRLDCNFVAACDGYHGIGRRSMPEGAYTEFQKEYSFSWLGILAHAVPASDELIYAYHERGFALHSLRSDKVSRLYLQVENNDLLDNWSDEKIWDELDTRLADGKGFTVNRGAIFEKGITPMRSFMIDNMQHGRLFLAGDAAHIVPPTGGKGLNLAVADVKWMAAALTAYYKKGDESRLQSYTADCLKRIWRAQDFSNFMTYLFHKQAAHGSFEYQLQKSRFQYIASSQFQAASIAENYVGIKFI